MTTGVKNRISKTPTKCCVQRSYFTDTYTKELLYRHKDIHTQVQSEIKKKHTMQVITERRQIIYEKIKTYKLKTVIKKQRT